VRNLPDEFVVDGDGSCVTICYIDAWTENTWDSNGDMAALGVEAFLDSFGRQVLLITIMEAT